MAIFGGVLFTAEATNLLDFNGQFTTKLTKKDRPKPPNG